MTRTRRTETAESAAQRARASLAPWWAWALALSSLLASGCSLYPTVVEPGRGGVVYPHLTDDAVLLDVEVTEQQTDNGCGLACLSALLEYHGASLDAEAARRFPRAAVEQHGVAAGELRDYFRHRGFRAALVHGTLDHVYPTGILYLLERGLPLLVELAVPRPGQPPSRHYVLVIGFDPDSGLVFLMDPSWGIGAATFERFHERWAPTGHLVLVVARPDDRGHGRSTRIRR